MSYKIFSSAQGAPSKDSPADKSASAADQPATQTEKAPAEVAPAQKS